MRVWIVIRNRRLVPGLMYEVTKEQQESGGPNNSCWGLLFFYFICLLFNLKVKFVSTTTTVCASLCINHRTNNLFYNTVQNPENAVCVTFTKWHRIVIETRPEHCK